ncbi:hypothetical protein NJLHNGOC_08905 [Novacetimonas cocois]|uniref:Uncharacterized protein n=1 Tax=Novacetimonas cocois TaxID=1747507 RepID=A0A365YUX0_9PROT|nr:hypothetical protein NJLHNGOC_08905 [Novacetimonas cocois]
MGPPRSPLAQGGDERGRNMRCRGNVADFGHVDGAMKKPPERTVRQAGWGWMAAMMPKGCRDRP